MLEDNRPSDWGVLASKEQLTLSKLLLLNDGDVFHYGICFLDNAFYRGHVKYVCFKTRTINWSIRIGSLELPITQIYKSGVSLPFRQIIHKMVKSDWESQQFFVKQ